MKKKGHKTVDAKKDDVYYINLTFVLSTYKILIQIDNNYQLDLRNSKFGELIGFTEKIVKKTDYGMVICLISQIPLIRFTSIPMLLRTAY